MKAFAVAILFLSSCLGGHAQEQNDWAKADLQTIRLAPREFSQLPRAIVTDLEKRGCTIPQSYMWTKPHNIAHGAFRQKGQKDWAVLCSVKRSSAILIYWNSTPKDVSKIARRKDSDYLRASDPGKIGYSRIIGVADAKFIIDHYKAYGGTEPPKLTHQGLEDGWAETASAVHYLHRGKWLKLQGAD